MASSTGIRDGDTNIQSISESVPQTLLTPPEGEVAKLVSKSPPSTLSKVKTVKNDINNQVKAVDYPLKFKDFQLRDKRSKDPNWSVYSPEHFDIVSEEHFATGLRCLDINTKSKLKSLSEINLNYKSVERSAREYFAVTWPQNPSNIVPHKFELFSFFPPEVRREIWRLALPEPRVIVVSIKRADAHTRNPFKISLIHGQNYVTQLPSTCKESASVFHEHYHRIRVRKCTKLSFTPMGSPIKEKKGDLEYVDGKRDTILVYRSTLFELDPKGNHYYYSIDFSTIEHLAIGDYHPMGNGHLNAGFLHKNFPDVKDITFVVGEIDIELMDTLHKLKKTFQLHLTNAGCDLRYMEFQDNFENLLNASKPLRSNQHTDTEIIIQSIILKGNVIRKRMPQIYRSSTLSQVKFHAALISWQQGRWAPVPHYPKKQVVWLKPILPQPYDVVYYVGRPIDYLSTDRLIFPELPGRVVECQMGGVLTSVYDGIKELFDLAT